MHFSCSDVKPFGVSLLIVSFDDKVLNYVRYELIDFLIFIIHNFNFVQKLYYTLPLI